jgi:hypothetical protein
MLIYPQCLGIVCLRTGPIDRPDMAATQALLEESTSPEELAENFWASPKKTAASKDLVTFPMAVHMAASVAKRI